MVGGVKASDGSWIDANQKLDGGPSVLYDAVALVLSDMGVQDLVQRPPARDFVADAFAHAKFIGYTKAAMPLFEKAGISRNLDAACIVLDKLSAAADFIKACRALRFWDRESKVPTP